jgi:hypothetical protein
MWNLEEIENTQIFCHNLLALFYRDPSAWDQEIPILTRVLSF